MPEVASDFRLIQHERTMVNRRSTLGEAVFPQFSSYVSEKVLGSRASVKLFLVGRMFARGSIFGRMVRRVYRFLAYAKPSDF